MMEKQIAERMALITEMQAMGVLVSPVEYLETPAMLVNHLTEVALLSSIKRLKRTRKPRILYSLNGRVFSLPRRDALLMAKAEAARRGTHAH